MRVSVFTKYNSLCCLLLYHAGYADCSITVARLSFTKYSQKFQKKSIYVLLSYNAVPIVLSADPRWDIPGLYTDGGRIFVPVDL